MERPAAAVAAAQCRRQSSAAEPKPFSAIPGPKGLPVLGSLLDLRRNTKQMHVFVDDHLKKYGDIVKLKLPGGHGLVLTGDPVFLEDILRGEGKYPSRPGSSNVQWIYKNGLNLPTPMGFADGEDWKRKRSASGKQIMPRNVQKYTGPLNDVCQRFTKSLRSFRDGNDIVSDVAQPLRLLLMELSARFAYGLDMKMVDGIDEDGKIFGDIVRDLLESLTDVATMPPLFKIYPTKGYRLFLDGHSRMLEVATKHAKTVKQRIASGADGSETVGMLEEWLRDGVLTEEEAIFQAVSMFVAGVDTTSSQACFLLFELAKRPEIQHKLYSEIKSVLGDSKQPTTEDLSKMPYMKGCVLESFRYCGTSPFNIRILAQDMTLGVYHIPTKTIVIYSNYTAAKNEKLFPNPEKFDPERWKRDERNAFAMLPFGFGPRSCYGRRFAELELKLILIQMVRNFLMSTDMEEVVTEFAALRRPVGKVSLRLMNREV